MEAHTPKREAVEKLIKACRQTGSDWQIRVVDEQNSPVILLEAVKGQAGAGPKTLEIHSRQITLTHDDVDESTKKLIKRWIESLATATAKTSH